MPADRLTALLRRLRDLPFSPLPVAMVATVAAAAWAFIGIAGEVREGEMDAFDRGLLLWFRQPDDLAMPVGPRWLELAMVDVTTLGGTAVLVVVVSVAVGFMLVARKPGAALFTVLSIGGGTAFSQLLKLLYDRPRPDLVTHLTDIHTASFPSGHATMSAIVYLTLAAMIVRLVDRGALRAYVLVVAVLLSAVVGVSRVYLGVHWPTDVLAGWALGTAWACCSWLVVAGLRRLRA